MGATLGEVRELLQDVSSLRDLGRGSSSRELERLNDSLYPPWAVMQARDKPPLYLGNDIGVSCIPVYLLQLSILSHSSVISNLRHTQAPRYS